MLTDDFLVVERPNHMGDVQRVYRFPSGMGLSLINTPMAHGYPFAWEAAVLNDVGPDGNHAGLNYDTPFTSDVVVFDTDEETNEFIRKAAELIG